MTVNGTTGPGAGGLSAAVLMFNWIEYCVFGSMLFFSLLIGVYYGWFKKQDTVAEYMLGGKTMGVLPVTLSLTFSHVSGVTLLGVPAEIYSYGTQYSSIALTNIAILFIVNYLYLPVFYNLQLNSLYEYLELRFCKGTRTFASLIFAISLVIFIPIVIYTPALAFNQVTGVSVHVIAPIISLICIFYTSFGGLKAVVWTDSLQSLFTLGSIIFIVVLGFIKIGSVSEVIRINEEGGRFEFFNMNMSPFERNTLWSISLGSTMFWVAQLAVHPGAVQRFIAVSTFKEAKAVMFWSVVGFFVIKALVITIGLLLYATYHDCDPVATKLVRKTSQMLPYYVMGVARDFPGITGLFISGIVSAALSTMSAGLNTVAGTLYEDFVQFVLRGRKQSELHQSYTIKAITITLGVICTLMVLVVERLGSLFQMAVSLIGVTNGALVGVFSLGLFFPRANSKGAMMGALASLIGMAIMTGGSQFYILEKRLRFPGKVTSVDGCPHNLTDSLAFNASALVHTWRGIGSPVVADSVPLVFQISYMYYGAVGTLISMVVGLAVSYATEAPDPASLDPRLFSPPVRRFLPQKQRPLPPAEQYTLVTTDPAATLETKENQTHTTGT